MRKAVLLLVCIAAVSFAGCGNQPKVIHGTVTAAGQTPDSGEVRFVPIEGTTGPINAGPIVGGKYEIKGRGGVPPGKYRVQIVAKKKTGRTVQQYNGFEMAMVEEQIQISPPVYATESSPLTHEVSAGGDAKIDFDLPAN